MKLIRFTFACSRKVPFYAQLCNHYLNYQPLEVTVAWKNRCFILEAEGEQQQLEILAAAISEDFLYSIWLTDAQMQVVQERIGGRTPISVAPIEATLMSASDAAVPFCNHCHPLFSDNQSAQFGEMGLSCSLCHGEQTVHAAKLKADALSLSQVQQFAAHLRQNEQTTIGWAGDQYEFRLTPFNDGQRAQVLVCNPNRLAAHFAVENHHVLALSSLEKPAISVPAKQEHASLELGLFDLRFAWNRVLSVFAEVLRQQGIDYVFYRTSEPNINVAWVNGGWSELSYQPSQPLPAALVGIKEPLHDSATIDGLTAQWRKNTVSFSQAQGSDTSERESYALCALHGGNMEAGILRNSAVVYFSDRAPGQLIVLDSRLNSEVFFMLQPLPETGSQIIEQLCQRGRGDLVARFDEQFPHELAALSQIQFSSQRDNLTTVYVAAACIMGLASEDNPSQQQLADRVVAAAQSYHGKNAQRIDYAFDETTAISGLDFYQTLASVMAFRLATDGDSSMVPKLSFGIMDSLADYLSTWIEHLDGKHGIKQVVLAGNEMANECLTKRIEVRVGKNFTLFANRRLMLDGSNLSAGALLLKQRRRR
ncbi:hypothetical protein [Vibrio taketomensis]|uniref:hypothetical protein n=1 Tax=Vibrio taketomensis TaxID=2572923 RepID=UPI00138984DF|nr:hypothetical protein [Vibrio taketomensis]